MQSFVTVPHFVLCLIPRQLDGNVTSEIPPGTSAPRPRELIMAVLDYARRSHQSCRGAFQKWRVTQCPQGRSSQTQKRHSELG